MRLPIYARYELRSNDGTVLRVVERISVIDTEQSVEDLCDILEPWASESAQVFAVNVSLQNADIKKLRKDIVRAAIAASQ